VLQILNSILLSVNKLRLRKVDVSLILKPKRKTSNIFCLVHVNYLFVLNKLKYFMREKSFLRTLTRIKMSRNPSQTANWWQFCAKC